MSAPGKEPKSVNIHEAKTHLSRLVARVEKGETFLISRAGRPVARLIPFESEPFRRIPGLDAGRIWVADNFDDPLDEDDFPLSDS